ncbi:hypothetical protein RhiirA4_462283 [Rhizophagus irregularis]|uniref:Protein kinase domain-containing protein n=1 Tax=Rhizophagus irregularis TaxID=588596 RepID=A0A2I1GKK7_9GLOM|nr:hypothetical protein RhiirA4_462283 [Rhizophagus irregularis]
MSDSPPTGILDLLYCSAQAMSHDVSYIIHEVISGLPPYYDLSHDNNLAIKVYQELRPRFNIKVPQPIIIHLIKRCLDANSLNRPTAIEIASILCNLTEIPRQIEKKSMIIY